MPSPPLSPLQMESVSVSGFEATSAPPGCARTAIPHASARSLSRLAHSSAPPENHNSGSSSQQPEPPDPDPDPDPMDGEDTGPLLRRGGMRS